MSLSDTKVICFGEVLFDLLPSGAQPGGAPLNVAVHLQKLGSSSGIISRLGNDELGIKARQFLVRKGVDISLLQTDTQRETGVVRINIDKNDDPVYTINEKVAWDYIDDSFLKYSHQSKYVVHGSLISRSSESYASLKNLLKTTDSKIVFDLNIRSPYYSKSIIDELMKTANIVKMNMEEFNMLKDWFYIKNPKESGDMKALKALYPNLEIIIVTKGHKGATCWREGIIVSVPVYPVNVIDTIGSGDSFLAAFLVGIEKDLPLKETLSLASATGSFVAGKTGANPEYTEEDIYNFMSSSKN